MGWDGMGWYAVLCYAVIRGGVVQRPRKCTPEIEKNMEDLWNFECKGVGCCSERLFR